MRLCLQVMGRVLWSATGFKMQLLASETSCVQAGGFGAICTSVPPSKGCCAINKYQFDCMVWPSLQQCGSRTCCWILTEAFWLQTVAGTKVPVLRSSADMCMRSFTSLQRFQVCKWLHRRSTLRLSFNNHTITSPVQSLPCFALTACGYEKC